MYSHEAPVNIFTTGFNHLGSVTIVVPGTSGLGIGANQFVKVDAHAVFSTGCGPFTVSLDNDTGTATLFGKQSNFPVDTSVARQQSVSTSYVFPAAPGQHTYYFRNGWLDDADCGAAGPGYVEQVLIVATTHAVGATGHDVLAGS